MKLKILLQFTHDEDVLAESYTIHDFQQRTLITRSGDTSHLALHNLQVFAFDGDDQIVVGYTQVDAHTVLVEAPLVVGAANPGDRLSFDLMCLAEARQQSLTLTKPNDPVQMKAFRRENFRRNMLKGHAKRLLKNTELKRRICAGLREVKEDLLSIVRALLAVFAGGTLMGVSITPAVFGALAVMISKFGIAFFCEA